VESAPKVSAVAVYQEILCRHPEVPPTARRTLERIILCTLAQAQWAEEGGQFPPARNVQ